MFGHIVDYVDSLCARKGQEGASWNQVIRELFRTLCQFPGGLSAAVIKGDVELAVAKESRKINDFESFDLALAAGNLPQTLVLDLWAKLDLISGTSTPVILLRDREAGRVMEMYLHQRFRVLSSSPWKDAVFGKGDRKLKITGLAYKKPRLLPNDLLMFLLDDSSELDGLVEFSPSNGQVVTTDKVAAFKARVVQIGAPENVRLAHGSVRRIRLELANLVDSLQMYFDFYETSQRFVDLLKKGDSILVINPIVEATLSPLVLEYGTGTLLFQVPTVQTASQDISQSAIKTGKTTTSSPWDEMQMHPKRIPITDLGPHMRGVTLLGRVIMLRGHRTMRSSDSDDPKAQNACLRITDDSQQHVDVTLWEHLAQSNFAPGQIILLENLWTKLGSSGRPVISASPKHGAKLTNLSTFKPALSSPTLRSVFPLSVVGDPTIANFHSRVTVVDWKPHGHDLMAPCHRICGRSIESRTGSSYFCKHCDANVGEFDRDERFTIEWTIDDGIHQIRAVGRDTVSEDILGTSAISFGGLSQEDREHLLAASVGTEWDCSLTCLSFSKKEPEYYLDCVIPANNTNLEAKTSVEELFAALGLRAKTRQL